MLCLEQDIWGRRGWVTVCLVTRIVVRGVCVCVRVCVLPAIADLPWWVAEMLGCFNPVRRTGSSSSPMGSIGMIGCQWMYLWNVCERWVEVCITVLSITTKKRKKSTFEIWNNNKKHVILVKSGMICEDQFSVSHCSFRDVLKCAL